MTGSHKIAIAGIAGLTIVYLLRRRRSTFANLDMPIKSRRTISIPSDLDKEMRRLRNVNWSKIATDAFAQRIDPAYSRPGDFENCKRISAEICDKLYNPRNSPTLKIRSW